MSNDGNIQNQKLGGEAIDVAYEHKPLGFAGDCVSTTQRHFVDCSSVEGAFRDQLRRFPVSDQSAGNHLQSGKIKFAYDGSKRMRPSC